MCNKLSVLRQFRQQVDLERWRVLVKMAEIQSTNKTYRTMNNMIDKKVYPKNPLGIIALFVFLIEAISTVSLKILVDAQSPFVGHVIGFIISFPSVIVLLFFATLWLRRESLYSPTDFRDDASFVQLFSKMEKIEAKQEADQFDPKGDANIPLDTIHKLLDINEVQAALGLGKSLLKVHRYSSSFEVFKYIEARIPSSHKLYPKVLNQLAYSLIGQKNYPEAINILLKAQRETPGKLSFWPALGLAYSYLKTGNEKECDNWLSYAKAFPKASEYSSLVASLYPEFKEAFPAKTP